MKYYIYCVQRSTYNVGVVRELLATQKLFCNDVSVLNNKNDLGIEISGEKEKTISYLNEIEVLTKEELEKELRYYVNLLGLSCRYNWNNKDYMLLNKNCNKGVYQQNGLIIHQLKPNGCRTSKVKLISLGESKQEEKPDWYSEWKLLVFELMIGGIEYLKALKLSFILIVNKLNWGIKDLDKLYEIKVGKRIETVGRIRPNEEQFEFWVKDCLKGKIGNLDKIYSYYNGKELENLFIKYKEDFKEWLTK